jgi:hypothetical protein
MALCAETRASAGYSAVAFAPAPLMRLRPDGTLELAAFNHRALFRRCRWEKDPDQGFGGGKICVAK